jgi:hypothetical protein
MSKLYSIGQTIRWKWGNGTATGKIENVVTKKTEIKSKRQTITRNGSDDNPAIVIKQEDGTKIIKLASELE